MVGVAKWLRHQVVALACVGSNPTVHPICIPGTGVLVRQGVRVVVGAGQWITRVRGVHVALLLALVAVVAAACGGSGDADRIAAQRLFRNYLLTADPTAIADVRIDRLVDPLPPDFPLFDGLNLLGSAFTDTADVRQLIVGWDSRASADDIFDFYSRALDRDPWTIQRDPRVNAIDFLEFTDADDATFLGELRIAQEGDDVAVVVLIVRNTLTGFAPGPPSGSSPPPGN